MKSPYISIIIPVYNVANYIAKTLDSILQQSFKDYEIILIDDGSKDKSPQICKQYAEENSSIVFFSKKNEGVAKTRNRALDIIHGEYVFFIDSDDIIYPNSLEEVVRMLTEKQPDFLRYEFNTIDIYDAKLYPNYLRRKRKKYHGKTMDAVCFMQNIIKNEYYLCMHVFKRNIIEQNNIRFLDGCTYNEDTLFIIRYLQYCQRCLYSDTLLYGYRKYDGAVTAHFTEKHYNDVKRVYWELCKLAENNDIQMKRTIQSVAGQLALHLYNYVSTHHYIDKEFQYIENNCKQSALPIEWLFKRYLPNKLCCIIWRVLFVTRKLANRLI